VADSDDIIHQPLRLKIMAALSAEKGQPLDFPRLKAITQATDGNLGSHLTTLEKAGYVAIEKDFVGKRPRTQARLTAEGRIGINFLYTDASTDALVQALDPQWPGPLPHTVVIAPGGKIVYRHNGPIDPEKLKDEVLKHLGAFYTPEEKR